MASAMQNVNSTIDVSDATFDQEVLQRSLQTPVLVDFWAAWCAPCKALTPVLTKLAEDFAGAFMLAKVDTDTNQQLAQQCGIRSLPTVLLVKDGQIVDGFVGAQPENAIRALLSRHGVEPGAPREDDESPAVTTVAPGDRKQAIAALRAAREGKPDDAVLKLQLAKLLVEEGEYEEAEQTIKELPEDKRNGNEAARLQAMIRFGAALTGQAEEPALTERLEQSREDSEARYLLGLRKAMAGDFEGALETLLELVRRDRKYGDDAARKAMVDVFALLGNSGPLVKQFRSQLYSALN